MAKVPLRKNAPYKPGELEVILSLPPTLPNIHWLAILLERSEDAIRFVYRIAFEHGRLGKKARIQEGKIMDAKRAVDVGIGRKRARKA